MSKLKYGDRVIVTGRNFYRGVRGTTMRFFPKEERYEVLCEDGNTREFYSYQLDLDPRYQPKTTKGAT